MKVRTLEVSSPLAIRGSRRKKQKLSDFETISKVNHRVAIEEIRQQAVIQIVKVEEAAQAKYDAAVNDVQREIAVQVAEVETAALKKYNEAVKNIWREAANRIAQAEEIATKATDRAEAAATNAAETNNKVQARMKQLLGATARAEVLEKSAAAATFWAKRAEEEVKQMKGHLEMTRADMGGKVFGWPIQEEEGGDWVMGETRERDQGMDALEPLHIVTIGQSVQSHASAGTPTNKSGTLKPCQSSDTDMLDQDHDIYAPENASNIEKPDGGLSETKSATSIARLSGGKKVEEKGKHQEMAGTLENTEYHDERMGDSPLIPLENYGYESRGSRRPESSVQTSHKSPNSASINNCRVQNQSKRTTKPNPAHTRGPEVKPAQQHDWVPPPQKFSRPKSGGGKRVKICMPKRTTSESEPESQGETDSEEEMKKMATMYKYQPRKKNFFRKSHQREYDPRYMEVKTAIRIEMNELLGISKNDDIVSIDLATHDEVDGYENGDMDEPPLQPMRPYLEGNLLVEWNNKLCELFIEHLADKKGWELSDSVRDVLETAFENRLSTLQKLLQRLENKTQEEIDNMKGVSGKQQRASSRRDRLWLDRRQICMENLTGRDGQIDRGWRATLYMVETLTMARMSSDESEVDSEARPYYVVKRHTWRSTAVGAHLQFINSQMNRTSASGGIRLGNAPRKRVRIQGVPVSNRDPPTSCPKNFYSREFVLNLSNRAYSALKMKAEKELGG